MHFVSATCSRGVARFLYFLSKTISSFFLSSALNDKLDSGYIVILHE